ncbi:MAG: ABC transporter substrate-binding protein [Actinomycetia bacterium]|nr:ABC transporter substrate-binding protein [Actinomycetes bacterium]
MHRLVVLVTSVALFVTACTSATSQVSTPTTVAETTTTTVATTTTVPPTTTTTEAPDGFGGQITIGLDVAVESLNPFAPNSFRELLAGNLVWAVVYDIDPETWEKIPDVVKDLPSRSGGVTLNDDGSMNVRYEIADDAMWSDGEPITGFDLAFTAAAMRDMAIEGEGGIDPVMATVVGTEGDGKSATITFSEPTLAVEDALWIILPSQTLEGVDLVNGTDGWDWPSGGPFMVDEFDPFNEARFVRNDLYWKTDDQGRSLPYLDAVTITETTKPGLQGDEPTSPVGDFVLRAIDVATVFNAPEDFRRMEAAVADGAEFQRVRTPVIEHLTFNFSDTRYEGNPDSVNEFLDFRTALATAIDREQILEETGVPWASETPGILIPTGESAWSIYEAGIAMIPQLPDGATSVLTTTGNADERPKIVEAIAPAFTSAGVAYESELEDSQLFFQTTIVEGAYDIGLWAWVGGETYRGQLGLMEMLDPAASPPDGNYGSWGSGGTANEATARFSEIVAEARSTIDSERFDELVREAEAILAQELPLIPLYSRGSGLAVWPDVVSGIVHNGSRSTFTWNIETWHHLAE